MRGETFYSISFFHNRHFNPLPSCEGRRWQGLFLMRKINNFNPLPSCEGRLLSTRRFAELQKISIHSPHARGDPGRAVSTHPDEISIHSPHARGDVWQSGLNRSSEFQSTPLTRGETTQCSDLQFRRYISIHSPHARGDFQGYTTRADINISIHSPHARGDLCCADDKRRVAISIHSPHARGDQHRACIWRHQGISIHSPHARGDDITRLVNHCGYISIHSPHARGDFRGRCTWGKYRDFNPLPSCEGRRSPT